MRLKSTHLYTELSEIRSKKKELFYMCYHMYMYYLLHVHVNIACTITCTCTVTCTYKYYFTITCRCKYYIVISSFTINKVQVLLLTYQCQE